MTPIENVTGDTFGLHPPITRTREHFKCFFVLKEQFTKPAVHPNPLKSFTKTAG